MGISGPRDLAGLLMLICACLLGRKILWVAEGWRGGLTPCFGYAFGVDGEGVGFEDFEEELGLWVSCVVVVVVVGR